MAKAMVCWGRMRVRICARELTGAMRASNAGQHQCGLARPSESHAPRRASPEVQLRQRRQPPQRPRHSRPAVLPESIIPAAEAKEAGSIACGVDADAGSERIRWE